MQTTDGYRGIWFTLGQFSEYGDKYSGGLGTYTANHIPMAVYAPQADRTFFVYGGTTAADQRHLLCMAAWYDHRTHTVPRPVIVHDKQGVNDPHDDPSINIDQSGHVWVFVSGRGRKRPGFRYRSREPFSIDDFELLEEREMTYCQPHMVPGHGMLHLFTKYTAGRELYWQTSPDGRIWTEDRKLAGMGGHYQVSARHHGRVGSTFMYHPGGNVDLRTNLYYLETRDFGSSWTTVQGQPIQTPLSEVQNPALLIDYQAQGLNVYIHDLNFDAEGHPVILYITSRGAPPGPQNAPHTWRIARWTGSEWRTHDVTQSDHNYDTGCLHIEGDTWRIIGPTEPGPRRWATGGQMAVWTSSDRGATWSRRHIITRDERANHTYARRPLNAKDPFYALWADGDPSEYSRSRIYFGSSDGRCWQLPYDMAGETAQPIEMKQA